MMRYIQRARSATRRNMVLGWWQGRESKVNIDVKFEDVVRCSLPLA
jgi:hypothetical protein